MGAYKDFLALLLALGPKLPLLWPAFIKWYEATRELYEAVRRTLPDTAASEPGVLSLVVGGEAGEAETQIAALLAGETGSFDGTVLRWMYQFFVEHPELFAALLALLRKLAAGS